MMIKNRMTFISIGIFVSLVIIGGVIFSSGFLKNRLDQNEDQEICYMHASWNYNYSGIEEMTYSSDVIALVRVASISDEYLSQGMPYTEYEVNVITPILDTTKGESLIIRVTGGPDQNVIYQFADAPLLKIGEEMIIFCKENIGTPNQSYTILSGAQGRLYYSNGKLNSLSMIDGNVMRANGLTNLKIKDADIGETINQICSYLDKND